MSTGGVDRTGCLEGEEWMGREEKKCTTKAYPNRATARRVWEKALA